MFAPMAFTICFALLGSMLVAILVAPVLASFVLGKARQRESRVLRLVKAVYRPTLSAALQSRTLVVALSVAGFAGCLALLPTLGTEFIPTLEEGSILIGVAMTPSISLDKATETVMALERRIKQHPEVHETVSRIGRPEAGSHPHPVNYAEIHIELESERGGSPRQTKARLVSALSEELKHFPGVQLNFTQPIQNAFDELLSGIKAELAIKLYGEDLGILQGKAEEIEAAVKDVPGLWTYRWSRALASHRSRSLPTGRLRPARGGGGPDPRSGGIGRWRRGHRHAVCKHAALRHSSAASGSLPAGSRRHSPASGAYRGPLLIPLSQVAEVREVVGPIQINREKNQRRWVVQGNVRGRDMGGVVADVRERINERVDLPPGYFIEYGGQFENQQRAMGRLAIVVPIVIALVYLLLWLSFSSMRDALIVMVNVPLALIGGILGLYWTGEYLSVPASVGFIALFGIAVQNGVVLLSYFRQLRAEGKSLREAITEGALLRIRPVLMTALTTVLGLMPLLLSQGIGSEVQRPLAVVVVFGLTTSTLLTLYVLPAVYSWTGNMEATERRHGAG